MKRDSDAFADCVHRAETLKGDFRVALVCPDAETARMASLAKERGVAEPIAFGTQNVAGIETRVVGSPEEAVEGAVELCLQGGADTIMKGLLNTHTFLKAIVKSPFKTGYITHCSVLAIPGFEKPVVVSDGTVTPFPNLAQKVEITRNAIRCAQLLGKNVVNVAVLSANELILPGIPSGNDAAILCKMAERGQIASAVIDGPMALDSAFSKEACEKKGLHFAFEPPADVLIAPDLESAAMFIKSMVHLAGAQVAGVLWGTRNPVVLTSRADSERAKYVSLCLCKLAVSRQ
ncbi:MULTISPECIES: phosphate acyltransferase [Candidatus Cryosericum]|jgi:phosphate acetyltransferase|uniref:Phosphate acetyltransferase n=2 Tax=Candidatus Cryosericum TaxID=2498709 RepID=A0A398D7P8_9BACT|nr:MULTISPECIES: phosphate acyltransferase [Cryosericum]RIE07307.1 phosphate acetyltransferase [Candidatus Cryosericum odellii]RIE08001.1 phosphate acetyltransferase [Candidatus Cryosericum hinesii]RIE11382.1 phosphate acetyltransferase [Candidatus Cryosericum hinesii]RIE14359.1 phosphate acetyltransferase [Candidatus Cryosericum hinesii]